MVKRPVATKVEGKVGLMVGSLELLMVELLVEQMVQLMDLKSVEKTVASLVAMKAPLMVEM